jgi:hypothetical protein
MINIDRVLKTRLPLVDNDVRSDIGGVRVLAAARPPQAKGVSSPRRRRRRRRMF